MLLQGRLDGTEEGFTLGLEKGSEFGQELGFYKGFAEAWIQHLQVLKKSSFIIEEIVYFNRNLFWKKIL